MYRIRDIEKNCWVEDNIFLSPKGELYKIKHSLFGWTKIPLDKDRYMYHKAIDLYDKNNIEIHEGDYIKAQVSEDRNVIGVVAFITDLSAYVILCVDSDEFFTLGSEVSDLIEIIGNVFDGYKEE